MTTNGIQDYPVSPSTSFDLAPETTMLVNQLNDTIRRICGHMRVMGNDLCEGWFPWGVGNGSPAISYVSSTSYKVGGSDVTSKYVVGRRTKVTGTNTGAAVGTISAVSYSAPDTTVTVAWDAGSPVLASDSDLLAWLGPHLTYTALPLAHEGWSGIAAFATSTETAAGASLEKFISPGNFAYSSTRAANGHYIFPGGLQLAWGTIANAGGGGGTGNFERGFSATPWFYGASGFTGASTVFLVTSISATQIGLNKKVTTSGADATGPIVYFALGAA